MKVYINFYLIISFTFIFNKVFCERYLVRFKDSSTRNTIILQNHYEKLEKLIQFDTQRHSNNNQIKHRYNKIYQGYSGEFTSSIKQWIEKQAEVMSIRKDVLFHINGLQTDAPWGLTRISNKIKYNELQKGKFYYPENSGEGVEAYVLDTGININHEDFEGRAFEAENFTIYDNHLDDNGHGSHVAGIIGGHKFGVSKKVTLISVKVFNKRGSGWLSDIIRGIEYVAKSNPRHISKFKGKVINLSFAGPLDNDMNLVAENTVALGIPIVVSAGNRGGDACSVSPGSSKSVITVGSTDIEDIVASTSKQGPCVKIFAPGRIIESVGIGSKNETKIMSGTSMASPHVVGILAEFISLSEVKLTPKELYQKLIDFGTKDAILNLANNTINLLAHNTSLD